jgi:hypothetical protein
MPGMQNIVWHALSNALPYRPFPLRLPGMPTAAPKLNTKQKAKLRYILQPLLLRPLQHMHPLHNSYSNDMPGRPPPPTVPGLHRLDMRPLHKRHHANQQRSVVLHFKFNRWPKLGLQLGMQSRIHTNAPPHPNPSLPMHTRRSLDRLGLRFTKSLKAQQSARYGGSNQESKLHRLPA